MRYKEYERSAKIRSLAFELSFSEYKSIVIKNCFYCGSIPRVPKRSFQITWPAMNGIDRVNNKEGYINCNVVPCCIRCNKMKKVLSAKDFLDRIRKIYLYLDLSKWILILGVEVTYSWSTYMNF